MAKKTTDKTQTKSKSTKGKGTVAFLYNGMLKTGCARLFWTEDSDPTSAAKEHVENYGPEVKCRYVKCENPKKVFEKVLKELGDEVAHGSTVHSHATNLVNMLKTCADVKQAHMCELQEKKEKSAKADSKKSKKSKDDGADGSDEDKDEVSDEDEKDGSDDEVSDAEGSDEEEVEEEEEKPKKSSKKETKPSKSAGKKKGHD